MKLLTFPLLFLFFSCSKNENKINQTVDIISSYDWYPYQVHLVTVDSVTVVTYDSLNHSQVNNNIIRSDTTFLTAKCLQQSSYHFQADGALRINDLCNASQSDISASWSLTKPNILLLPLIGNGAVASIPYSIASGTLTKINNTEFEFYTVATQTQSRTNFGRNGSRTVTSEKITKNQYTIYRSK